MGGRRGHENEPSWRSWLRAVLAVSSAILGVGGAAQAQVPPRIAIAFDTSGSMAANLDGFPTFGDGVTTGCTARPGGELCGTNCTAGIDTDCDGLVNDSRMFVAKEALRNMVLAFGDVDWALARFAQTQGTNLSCDRVNDLECNTAGPFVTSYGNPQCNTGVTIPTGVTGSCPFNWPSIFPAACQPGSTTGALRTWASSGGGSPSVCINYAGACSVGGRGGDILVGFSDLGAFAGLNNSYAILSWLNGTETNFVDTTTPGNFCNSATTGDCELRPSGPTPLAGLLREVESYIVPIRDADSRASCRPYSVILLTDGVESCDCSSFTAPDACLPPRTAAADLAANGISTYVVGLGISPAARTQLNNIAASGGTDAGDPGGDTAYFADDPVTLSAGLSEIVRRSLRVEVCNFDDDDCDGLVDEGVQNACGGCGAVPAETCNGSDEDCDGRVDEGVSNACGTCGAPPAEACNRLDDDCDGIIDEGVCGTCVPSAEICDAVDNDCDGRIDEGLTRGCGSGVGECRPGTQTCVAGGWGTCVGGVGPTAEACDGLDNDCDGTVDGFSRACGSDVGACVPGAQVCTAGMWGACVGGVGPAPGELCDGVDNDCDSRVDEGNPGGGGTCGTALGICELGTLSCEGGALTCVGGVGPDPAESCNGDDDDCDGWVDEAVPTVGPCGSSVGECREGVSTCVGGRFQCVGARGPSAEVCDGLDNDCDGAIDQGNPGGGASCGSSTGACTPGVTQCMGGALTCVDGTGPSAELCNRLDDDCDGLIDEGNPGGGGVCGDTDVGLCSFGAQACVDGMLVCVGGRGPSAELCDGADNDCDMLIDEGDPESGGACGDDTGECVAGTFRCVGGALVCDGAVGPMEELCNGLDDDCDGIVDDGIPVGAPCGTDVGECVPGVNLCRDGAVVCDGAIGPATEECDNLDNDCDGRIDEGLGVGEACGTDVGLCMAGAQRCVDGRLVCEGSVAPRRESCDCEDNDCDGETDEPPDTGALCPPGSECVECQCALPCVESEFGFSCPTGRAPQVRADGQCFCVAPRCEAAACAAETIEQGGVVRCAPDRADVAPCVCQNNACTFACEGVLCSDGTVCDPRSGRCVEDSCRGLGCPDGQICDVDTGECTEDRCATAGCPAACRDGVCEGSCATVVCGDGQVCRAGTCVDDPCGGADCPAGQVCDPSRGTCVDDLCDGRRCLPGEVCDPVTGNCMVDPCATLRCPSGQVCEDGECALETQPGVDGGVDGGPDAGVDAGRPTTDERDRVLAAGGCACRATGGVPGGSGAGIWLAVAVGLLLVLRRRRVRTDAVAVMVVSSALVGCEVDPFCLDCAEPADSGVDAGQDAGRDAGRDAGPRDAGTDAGADACVPQEEVCNDADDDCDGNVDEGIDTATDEDHCGACGRVCAPIGAFGECVAGECTLGGCDVGRYDLDDDPSNGCEYRCLPDSEDDSICDLRDNDCDGRTDEDVDLSTDPSHCGACGRLCRFPRAAGSCEAGTCVLGTCEEGWYDVDGRADNGCEYGCTGTGTETCNGRDDDCDGSIDEGNPGGGGTCGSAVGECRQGVEECRSGVIVCVGEVAPTTEVCNGLDDDCDGEPDEGNPGGGRLCGSSTGICESGREVCTAGALVCTGGTGPGTESCNGLDDDCDGSIDEGNPGGGVTCGEDRGECSFGALQCRGGVLVCEGGTGPRAELCNGLDDDCDGLTDEENPGGGGSCGTDRGICGPGTLQCSGGTLSCVGATGPAPGGESCNSLDDDCDGRIDEGNPGGGMSCGTDVGACMAGTQVCTGGTLVCTGATGPRLETCNAVDDDCDTRVDEGFDTLNDVRNCGRCGNVCSFANATAACSSGACVIAACDTGWVDLDPAAAGCEYRCDFTGDEVCNGRDDDCDGTIDEALTAPSTFCNPNGVCAMTVPTCGASAGWQCNYPATYEPTEESCDGLDNDCDGLVDEPFPGVGTSCSNGTGACRRTGVVACTADRTGTRCTAEAAGAPASFESCNAIDDDCDGTVDEAIPVSAIPTVSIPRAGGGTVRVMSYEASRADATASVQGVATARACSNPNVLPWTNLTWAEAQAACCALNPSGACGAGGAGWRLCDVADWQNACEGPTGTCTWSYDSSCSTSSRLTCNGLEHDSDPTLTGNQDALYPTASSTFAMCFADWGAAGVVYDMSGNVKEWTATETATGVYAIRGGSYNNAEDGRTCQFDFTVGSSNFAFPNTGFRCCYY